MAACFLGLLLLILLYPPGWVSGSPVSIHSGGCGLQQIACVEALEAYCFFLDRKEVDHSSFCQVLESHVASGCLVEGSPNWEEWGRIHDEYCRVDSSGLGAAPAECINLLGKSDSSTISLSY